MGLHVALFAAPIKVANNQATKRCLSYGWRFIISNEVSEEGTLAIVAHTVVFGVTSRAGLVSQWYATRRFQCQAFVRMDSQ